MWKMIMTKKDSNALALKNIKGNIVKVQNVIHMTVTQNQCRVNFYVREIVRTTTLN